MINIGTYNELRVKAQVEFGYILTDGQEEAFLPKHHAPKDLTTGSNIHVFVFLNKEGELQATNQKPYACAGDFAYLKVVGETEDGVYLDLGIDKDVFVPNREQKRPMGKGGQYVVYVYVDDQNGKLLASSKVSDFVEDEDLDLEVGDEVSLLIVEQTDLGYNAIIDNKYIGLIYQNEVFSDIKPGDVKRGWIKKVRIGNKIDLSLQTMGYEHIIDNKEIIYKELLASGGVIALGDKSDPVDIYDRFQLSKSAFKKIIGALYKDRRILVGDYEIKLVKK